MSGLSNPVPLADYWRQQVDNWKNSGHSQVKFCQANELSYHRFVYWRQKFERDPGSRQAKRDSGGFAAVDYRPEVNGALTLSSAFVTLSARQTRIARYSSTLGMNCQGE